MVQEGASKRAVVAAYNAPSCLLRTLQPTTLAKTGVAPFANDDVVEDVHADQPAGVNESSRERHIVGAWRGVAARMIVCVMCRGLLCDPADESRRNHEGVR